MILRQVVKIIVEMYSQRFDKIGILTRDSARGEMGYSGFLTAEQGVTGHYSVQTSVVSLRSKNTRSGYLRYRTFPYHGDTPPCSGEIAGIPLESRHDPNLMPAHIEKDALSTGLPLLLRRFLQLCLHPGMLGAYLGFALGGAH